MNLVEWTSMVEEKLRCHTGDLEEELLSLARYAHADTQTHIQTLVGFTHHAGHPLSSN
jgi:hypothetical protein